MCLAQGTDIYQIYVLLSLISPQIEPRTLKPCPRCCPGVRAGWLPEMLLSQPGETETADFWMVCRANPGTLTATVVRQMVVSAGTWLGSPPLSFLGVSYLLALP